MKTPYNKRSSCQIGYRRIRQISPIRYAQVKVNMMESIIKYMVQEILIGSIAYIGKHTNNAILRLRGIEVIEDDSIDYIEDNKNLDRKNQ